MARGLTREQRAAFDVACRPDVADTWDSLPFTVSLVTVQDRNGRTLAKGTGFYLQFQEPAVHHPLAARHLLVTNKHVLCHSESDCSSLTPALLAGLTLRWQLRPIFVDSQGRVQPRQFSNKDQKIHYWDARTETRVEYTQRIDVQVRLDEAHRVLWHPIGVCDVVGVVLDDLLDTTPFTQCVRWLTESQCKISHELAAQLHTDEAAVFGFPNAFLDDLSLLPLQRSGHLAMAHGQRYENNTRGIMDLETTMGSSGAPVFLRINHLEEDRLAARQQCTPSSRASAGRSSVDRREHEFVFAGITFATLLYRRWNEGKPLESQPVAVRPKRSWPSPLMLLSVMALLAAAGTWLWLSLHEAGAVVAVAVGAGITCVAAALLVAHQSAPGVNVAYTYEVPSRTCIYLWSLVLLKLRDLNAESKHASVPRWNEQSAVTVRGAIRKEPKLHSRITDLLGSLNDLRPGTGKPRDGLHLDIDANKAGEVNSLLGADVRRFVHLEVQKDTQGSKGHGGVGSTWFTAFVDSHAAGNLQQLRTQLQKAAVAYLSEYERLENGQDLRGKNKHTWPRKPVLFLRRDTGVLHVAYVADKSFLLWLQGEKNAAQSNEPAAAPRVKLSKKDESARVQALH